MKKAQEEVKVWYFKSDQNYVPYDQKCQDILKYWNYNQQKRIYLWINKVQYEVVHQDNEKFVQYQVGLTDEQKRKRYRYVMFQLENDTQNDKPKTIQEELKQLNHLITEREDIQKNKSQNIPPCDLKWLPKQSLGREIPPDLISPRGRRHFASNSVELL